MSSTGGWQIWILTTSKTRVLPMVRLELGAYYLCKKQKVPFSKVNSSVVVVLYIASDNG